MSEKEVIVVNQYNQQVGIALKYAKILKKYFYRVVHVFVYSPLHNGFMLHTDPDTGDISLSFKGDVISKDRSEIYSAKRLIADKFKLDFEQVCSNSSFTPFTIDTIKSIVGEQLVFSTLYLLVSDLKVENTKYETLENLTKLL